jgi:hypothetical protein
LVTPIHRELSVVKFRDWLRYRAAASAFHAGIGSVNT